jgi:hypothetical protein
VRARLVVGERAVGLVAADAGDVADRRHARVVEQAPAKFDGQRLAGYAVARVGDERRRPRAERCDALDFGGRQQCRFNRLAGRRSRDDAAERHGAEQPERSRTHLSKTQSDNERQRATTRDNVVGNVRLDARKCTRCRRAPMRESFVPTWTTPPRCRRTSM